MFRTYFINNRGDEQMGGTWNYLDITALGRQEEWEDLPEGYPQTPTYKWWNWHDSYGAGARPEVGRGVGCRLSTALFCSPRLNPTVLGVADQLGQAMARCRGSWAAPLLIIGAGDQMSRLTEPSRSAIAHVAAAQRRTA